MENVSTWTHLYYVSCMIIAAAAAIGIWQLFIMKHDIKTRNRRAAAEYSMQIALRYHEKFMKILDELYYYGKEKNLPEYKGTPEELPDINYATLNKRIEIIKNFDFHILLNELEYISAVVLSGLCNEELSFELFGRSLCRNVAKYYDILNPFGSSESYIMELFEIWRERVKKEKLMSEKKKLSAKQKEIMKGIKDIMDKRVPTIK